MNPEGVATLSLSSLPTYHGYISPTANGRYFQDEDGKGFVVIGHNDAITWPGLQELLEGDAAASETYVADLRAHGITVSRIMMEYAQERRGLLEDPVGVFSPNVVRFWDSFIHIAEHHNLYLMLTPYDTFWQVLHWRAYPYHHTNGGPCKRKRDWLTDRASINAHKRRWEFVIRRWGGSPNIFAWDIMNEIDLYWKSSPTQIARYISEIAAYIHALEMHYWGKTHLITVSSAAAVPQGALGEVIYNHPDLDFVNTHLYAGEGIKAPANTIEGALNYSLGVAASLDAMQQVRPYFDSESGPIDGWIHDQQCDTEYHHNMSFAHLASGGAGSGMRWPYSNPHYLLPGLRDNLFALARFAASIDWVRFSSRNISHWMSVHDECVLPFGCGDANRLVLWFLRDSRRNAQPILSGITVIVRDVLLDGQYRVDFWETWGGYRYASLEVAVSDGLLNFTLITPVTPTQDIAVSVYPASEYKGDAS
jgi:mannan endo-1,4-beta-mannosidase